MKKFVVLFIIIVAACLYLNRSYALFYNAIGHRARPVPPYPVVTTVTSTSAVVGRTLVYVALGDSLTAGVGVGTLSETYPYQLAAHVAAAERSNVTLVNLGIPGATSADLLREQIPKALAYKSDIVTIMIGVNDMHNRVPLATYSANILSIVRSLKATGARVFVIESPYLGSPVITYPPYGWYFDYETRRYNAAENTALRGQGVTVIDMYEPTVTIGHKSTDYYSGDGFHPSAVGYALWSTFVYDHFNF